MRLAGFSFVLTVVHDIHELDAVALGPFPGQTWDRTSLMRFRLDISGYGLSKTDSIRIISAQSACTDDSGDPQNVESTIQWNCPDIEAGCSTITSSPSVDIPTQAESWDCVNFDEGNNCVGASVYLISLVTETDGHVILTFSGETQLAAGDFVKFTAGASCGADCEDSDLDLLLAGPYSSVSDEFIIGHALLVDSADPVNTFRILVSEFAQASPPQFTVTNGEWFKTSQISTRVEIMGLAARVGLRVCWNGGGKSGGYTTDVGELVVADPELMPTSGLFPVTAASESTSIPVIVAFTTGALSVYDSPSRESILSLFVTKPSVVRILDTAGNELVDTGLAAPSQTVCANIFSELWASKSLVGFPHPKGCTVRKALVGADLVGVEIRIFLSTSFTKSTNYQLVVNMFIDASLLLTTDANSCCSSFDCFTVAAPVWERGCQYLVLSVVDGSAPYKAIEVGRPQFGPTAPQSFVRTLAMPFLTSAELLGGEDDLITLVRGDYFTISLGGGDSVTTGSLQAGNIVRLIFSPLTQWRVGTECSAEIVDPDLTGFYTGSLPECVAESVVPGGQTNVVRLRLPSDLPNVNQAVRIQIQISGIMVLSSGFFPAFVGVEIGSAAPDWSRHFVSSTGTSMWKAPDAGRTVARIVREAQVTEFSFKADLAKDIYVQVLTRINAGPGDQLAFTLPEGFVCVAVDSVTEAEAEALLVEQPDLTGFGSLGEAGWIPSGNTCSLTLGSVAVFHLSYLMFKLTVDCPVTALPLSDPSNVLSFSITSGELSYSENFFAPPNDSLFVSAIPVLGVLANVMLTPLTSWAVSEEFTEDPQIVSLLFTPEQAIEAGGTIRIDFPRQYIPVSPCTASSLPAYIYCTADVLSEVVHRVPQLQSECVFTTADSSRLRLEISVAGSLSAGERYGVGFSLQNPWAYVSGSVEVRTVNSVGDLVDGSEGLVNPTLFEAQTELAVALDSWQPYSLSTEPTSVTLSFSHLQSTVDCRIRAPRGFVIDPSVNSDATVSVSVGTWTVGPDTGDSSVLDLIATSLLEASSYEFTLLVRVPDRMPTSLYLWSIEFEGGENGDRFLVALSTEHLESGPPVQGIINARVTPSSTVSGDSANLILFEFQTITPIPSAGGRLTIAVPTGVQFDSDCEILGVSSVTLGCAFGGSELVITHPGGDWEAGFHSFMVTGVNGGTAQDYTPLWDDPDTPCLASACFTFASWDGDLSPLDLALSVPGFSLTKLMARAGIVPDTVARDDRPGHSNELVLYFQPSTSADSITVIAPAGFLFAADCTVSVSVNAVFNDGRPWNPSFALWPEGLLVSACTSRAAGQMRIQFSGDLVGGEDEPFAIRIAVEANPDELVLFQDFWTIQVGEQESSLAFTTFPLWTFEDPVLEAMVTGALDGAEVLNLVTLQLRPFHTIPVGGWLRIEPPAPEFSLPPLYACPKLRIKSSASVSIPAICVIDSGAIELTLLAPILNAERYSVSLVVANVASEGLPGVWLVQSSLLDEASVPSFTRVTAPVTLAIANPFIFGNELVDGLRFRIASSVEIVAGMSVTIEAPAGFNFTDTSKVPSALCQSLDFASLGGGVEFAPSSLTTATCLETTITIFAGETFGSELLWEFSIDGLTPSATPSPSNLFVFTVTDADGVVVESGSVFGWDIVPQLKGVDVELVGPNLAVSSLSNINLTFTTVSVTNKVVLNWPTSFRFSVAQFALTRQLRTQWLAVATSRILLNANIVTLELLDPLDAGTTVQLHLVQTQLGSDPGPVLLTITTWRDSLMADARVQFPAFSLASPISVFDQSIFTYSTQSMTALEPVESIDLIAYFVPRTDEVALVALNFTLADPVPLGSVMKVQSEFYRFLPTNELSLSKITNRSTEIVTRIDRVYISLSSAAVVDKSLVFHIDTSLTSGANYSLEVPVKVPSQMSRAQSAFLVDIFAQARDPLPSHTNDNSTFGFTVVSPVEFFIAAPRSPPSARIAVDLTLLSVGSLAIYSLLVVAPAGFVFDADCLISGASSCVPGPILNDRHSGLVSFQAGLQNGDFLPLDISLSVVTPLATPQVNSWVVVGNGLAGLQTGWGSQEAPFEIVDMKQVTVSYANLFNTVTQVAFTFENAIRVRRTGRLRVYYPPGFQFDCTSFSKVTLPFYGSNWDQVCTLNLASLNSTSSEDVTVDLANDSFDIYLLDDLVPGTFSFTIEASTPTVALTTEENLFSVVILSETDQVLDSFIGVPGGHLTSTGVRVVMVEGASGFEWYPSLVTAGSKLEIEIKFSFLQKVSLDESGELPFNSMVVFFPDGFTNALESSDEVTEISGSDLIQSIDISNKQFLTVTIDATSEIAKGTYGLRFPVWVPLVIPDVNIWNLAFCKEVCETPGEALVSLPIGGFLLGQEHPYTRLLVTRDGAGAATHISLAIVLLLLI